MIDSIVAIVNYKVVNYCSSLSIGIVQCSGVARWNSCVSRLFSFTCGASRWSPFTYTLFAVYVDDLIRKLVEPGLGCSVGSENIGCLFYADDIVLLSWSLGLSANCKIC